MNSESNYTDAEVVDTVEASDGTTYRARIEQDIYADEPYFCEGCPIIRVESRYGGLDAEMTSYGAGQNDGLPDDASDILRRFNAYDKRTAIDTFERYLKIYHDGNLVEYGPNRGTDYTYVAYVTRTLWESWGNTGEVGRADLDEWRAYVEGDTYGVMVEYRPTVELDGCTDPEFFNVPIDHDGWTETDATCWGFYGQQYAEESAREELAAEVKFHNAEDKAATLLQL